MFGQSGMFGQSAVLSHDSPPMEVVRKAMRTVTGRNARGAVVEVQREVEEAIIDDHMPAIADLFAKWLRQGATPRWMPDLHSPARGERPHAATPGRPFHLGSPWPI